MEGGGQKCAVGLYLALLTFLFMMQSPVNYFSQGIGHMDGNVFRYIAMAMSEGLMPYKDAFDHKGPLLYLYNYLGMQLSYYRGIWIVECISLFVYLWFAYKASRLFCNRIVSCFLVFVTLMPMGLFFRGGNFTEEFALPYTMASLYIFMDYFYNQRIGKARLAACGFCFGAVCLLRVNMIAVWLCFPLAVLIYNWKTDRKKILCFLAWFLAGFALIMLPVCLWLLHGGALGDFVRDYIVFNLRYSSGDGIMKTGLNGRLDTVKSFLGYQIIPFVMAVTLYLCVRKRNLLFDVTYLACNVLTLLLMCMAGTSYGHYGMMIVPCFIYPLARLYQLWHEESKTEACALVGIWLLALALPLCVTCADKMMKAVRYPDSNVAVRGGMRNTLQLIEENTLPEDKIIVLGNCDILYVLSHRLAASRYSYQLPIFSVAPEMGKEFREELDDNLPKIIVDINNTGILEDYLENRAYNVIYSWDNDYNDESGTVWMLEP